MHGNPWHAIFTILWFGMLYFYPLKFLGWIGMQQRSTYHSFLNNTLIMIVNVFCCVQVRSFGQVAGIHISCIWMSLFKWDEYFYHIVWRHVACIYREGMLFLHFGKQNNSRKQKMPITMSNRSCARQRERLETGSSVFRNVFCVHDPWAHRSIWVQPFAGVGMRIKLDLIWIRPLGSTSRRLLRCSMNVI